MNYSLISACHNDALLKMKFTRFCDSVSDSLTNTHLGFLLFPLYSGLTVVNQCPVSLSFIYWESALLRQDWGSKSLYCSVHYRVLVVGLFLLLWLE